MGGVCRVGNSGVPLRCGRCRLSAITRSAVIGHCWSCDICGALAL